MSNWKKVTPLVQQGKNATETWVRQSSKGSSEFSIDLYLGKKTNLLSLKKDIVDNVKEKITYYQDTRRKLYAGETEYVPNCPVTGIHTTDATHIATIYGAEYVQTPDTGHVYVSNRPTQKTIRDFYLSDETYAATYTDKEGAESRLNSIAVPWREWAVEVFEKHYGRTPKSVLDVGSGAGHFVEACRREGMDACGVELSETSRQFASDIWGLELDGRDFLATIDDYRGYDLVTFWGLLEHTPNPQAMLKAAHAVVSAGDCGMVISKLPRWNSLSSAAQRLNPETIIRHIDPMGHIMLFSDASAAELYVRSRFAPVAAWYYGMDVYETLMQFGNHVGDYKSFIGSGELQVELQQFVDEARFSDGITLVGVPR